MVTYIRNTLIKKGTTCLLRIDLNVESLKDLFRVESVVPTIKFLRKKHVKIVILSHRGRPHPEGQGILNFKYKVSDEEKKRYTLRPFSNIVSKKIGEKVKFIDRSDIQEISEEIRNSKDEVFILENMRFWREEEMDSMEFGRQLASLGDFYVNDAFAVSHRANASVSAITRFLPSYGGLLLEKELENLDTVIHSPKHPFVILIGGMKVSDKVGVVKFFWKNADSFLFGGGAANTCLAARGASIGTSLVDEKAFEEIRPYLASLKIHLPVDTVNSEGRILDIGQKTISEYTNIIADAKTIIWSGPMGFFEKKKFSSGTTEMWKTIIKLANKNKKIVIIIGGGETIASLKLLITNYKLPKNIFLSTGGGAMLAYLSGEKLPGIEALKK